MESDEKVKILHLRAKFETCVMLDISLESQIPVITGGLKSEPQTCNAVSYLTHRAKMFVKAIFTLIFTASVNHKTSSTSSHIEPSFFYKE